MGSYLANRLSSMGYGITIVDHDPRAFKNLSLEFSGFHVTGDIIEYRTMKKAKLDKAGFFIATTGDDNSNIMAAQVASEMFEVAQVVARVEDPKKDETISEMGIQTVCPTSISAEVFLNRLALGKGKSILKGWL